MVQRGAWPVKEAKVTMKEDWGATWGQQFFLSVGFSDPYSEDYATLVHLQLRAGQSFLP